MLRMSWFRGKAVRSRQPRVSKSNFYRAIHFVVACRVYVTKKHENFVWKIYATSLRKTAVYFCLCDRWDTHTGEPSFRESFPDPINISRSVEPLFSDIEPFWKLKSSRYSR